MSIARGACDGLISSSCFVASLSAQESHRTQGPSSLFRGWRSSKLKTQAKRHLIKRYSNNMATKVEIRKQGSGGAEAMLDSAAVSIVFLGLLLSAVSGLLFPYGGAVVIGLTLLNTAIAYYLFRALAEIVRLLKHSAGIPFSGRIAAGPITTVYKLSLIHISEPTRPY